MALYKMKDLIAVTGWTRKKLSQWLQQGIVKAEVPPKRAGVAAEFSFNNIIQFILTDKLVNAGLSVRKASELAEKFIGSIHEAYSENPHVVGEYWVAIDLENSENYIYFESQPDMYNQDITLVLRLHKIYIEVADKISALEGK